MNNTLKCAKKSDLANNMDAHIIFGVISVLNDNTCTPSIDALRTTHGDNKWYLDKILYVIHIRAPLSLMLSLIRLFYCRDAHLLNKLFMIHQIEVDLMSPNKLMYTYGIYRSKFGFREHCFSTSVTYDLYHHLIHYFIYIFYTILLELFTTAA